MDGKIGDRIIIESEKVGHPPREGEVLEVIVKPSGTDYRVRWEDGHESSIRPSGGSARFVSVAKAKKKKRGRA